MFKEPWFLKWSLWTSSAIFVFQILNIQHTLTAPPRFSLFIALCLLTLISLAHLAALKGIIPFRETFVGGFFGLSSSSAAVKYFRQLQFPSCEEPRYTRLWAVGLNADRRAPSWITPHQTLQSLTIYWAKHRWEGSPLFHTHTHIRIHTCVHTNLMHECSYTREAKFRVQK